MTLKLKALSSAALFGSALVLAACGGGNGSNSTNSNSAANGSNAGAKDARSNLVEGPLDVVQDEVVTNIVANQLGGTLPEPLGPTVQCASDAVNSLLDGPDALLAALMSAGTADPATALQGAADQFVGSMERFAAELQSTLMALTGSGNCSTVAGGDSDGTPLAGNPLAGTPLEPVGSALEPLVGALGGFSGSDDDPNLTSVTNTIQPLLAQLSDSFSMVPDEARDAPVVGGILQTLEGATNDLAVTLPFIGNYEPNGTNAGVENLLNNLLSNVLLRVIPVEAIDEQTGQDFSSQIQGGIDTLTSTLGGGTGQLITPLFNDLLNGAASPALDPVEQLLQQILGQVPLLGLGGEPATGNPLTGLLGGIAGNGTGTPLDALLGLLTFGSTGTPLDSLTGALGGSTTGSPLDQVTGLLGNGGLPLDSLLGQLTGATAGTPLDGLLSPLTDLLGGLLGGNQG